MARSPKRRSGSVFVSDDTVGEEVSVGEGNALPSRVVDAPVSVEHPDPTSAPSGSTTKDSAGEADPFVSAPGITTEPGVDSGQTNHSVDYSKSSEEHSAPVGVTDAGTAAIAVPEPSEDQYVDLTGKDVTKNDEVPSARDGIAVSLDARNTVEYSNGICPLVASDADVKSQRESVTLGSVEMTSRQPFNVLVNPITCPTCQKQVEGHQLVWDPTNPGVRDCASAIAMRAHPVSKEILTASDNGNDEKAARIADRHPLGARILEILGLRKKSEA